MQFEGLNSCLGLELNLLGDNHYSCRYCLLSKKNNALDIEGKKIIEGSLAKVMEALPKSQPIALCLTGKGIVHKNIQIASETSSIQVFQQAFPSVDQKEFYTQQFEQDNHALISIIRKTVVDSILETLKMAGFKLYNLSLGAAASAQVWSQLNIYGPQLIFDGHEFNLSETRSFLNYRFEAGSKNRFPVKIEQETLAEELILAYANAFQLLLHDKLALISSDVESVNNEFASYIENSKLKKKGLIFLSGLFMALLISFMVFSHYNQENSKLSQQVGAMVSTADQTDLLKKSIAENENLLKQLNWNGGYNYGFILNEIGSSMPKQLSLKEITANDYRTDVEKQERKPMIRILGETDDLTAVNNWIFVLKEKKWVRSVKLLRYQEDPESEKYQFNLLVEY